MAEVREFGQPELGFGNRLTLPRFAAGGADVPSSMIATGSAGCVSMRTRRRRFSSRYMLASQFLCILSRSAANRR